MLKNARLSISYVFRLAPFSATLETVLSLALAILMPVQILVIEKLLNTVTEFISAGGDLSGVVLSVALLVFLFCLQAMISHFRDCLSLSLKRKIDYELSARIIDKYRKVRYDVFENSQFYDTINRISEEPSERLYDFFHSIITIVSFAVELICVMSILMNLSVLFGVSYGIVLLIVSAMNFVAMNQMNDMLYGLSPSERRLAYLENIISNKTSLYELRVYQAVKTVLARIKTENDKVLSQRLKTTISAQKFCFLANIATVAWIGIVFGFLIVSLKNGTASAGIIVALLSMINRILSSSESLSYEVSSYFRNSYITRCLFDFFALKEETSKEVTLEEDVHTIEFRNVAFRYTPDSNYVLEDINLTFRSDENIALVGYNGAGKSTMILLLCKLLEPMEGTILIDGIPLGDIPREQLSRIFTVVFQDYGKYFLTVRENIALGRTEAISRDDELVSALNMAGAASDFPDLSRNIGRLTSDGSDLSEGQWQKLAVARAFFSRRKFFIFDEPTASLDAQAENNLYMNLKEKLNDKGCIFISHRLPSAIMADRIVVLNNHRIAETGSHEELLRQNGIYAEMYRAQAEAYVREPGKEVENEAD